MGNQPSKPPSNEAQPPQKAKKPARRTSVKGLSAGKAAAAGPSASHESATAQTIPQHVKSSKLEHHLQVSQSPEATFKSPSGAHRSSSRGSRPDKKDHERPESEKGSPETRIKNVPTPEKAEPMAVPIMAKSRKDEFLDASSAPFPNHYTPIPHVRPPRLPLPIADVPVPDSPSLDPIQTGNDDISVFEQGEPEEKALRRESSMLSNATEDEQEISDELQVYAVEPAVNKSVPTRIEWNQGCEDKVYVTGTFANWDKKFKLHPNKSGNGLHAMLQLPPGTHHLKFIVDSEMRTSKDLPTAVDFTNVLVNYIEVSADDIPRPRRESEKGAKNVPTNLRPPQVLPEEEEEDDDQTPQDEQGDFFEEEVPVGDFRQLVPQAYNDIELPEDDPRFQQAYHVIGDTPGPPSLPLFLVKSILNGVLPLKDDSSVLGLPNHTVLNHLATSSIKNNVLATSVTTRYKDKYVTSIMYKPVPVNEE